MSPTRLLPAWADDLRRRYARGEASMFVLHGNVYDGIIDGQRLVTLTDFLTDVLLKDTRETITVFNVATGVRFTKRASTVSVDDLLLANGKDKLLAALERLLIQSNKAAVIIEYAEAVAPTGDPAFQADADRAAMITLHRWSFLPEIEKGDNVVILIAENLTDLAPKLVSNPKVATISVPLVDSTCSSIRPSARSRRFPGATLRARPSNVVEISPAPPTKLPVAIRSVAPAVR